MKGLKLLLLLAVLVLSAVTLWRVEACACKNEKYLPGGPDITGLAVHENKQRPQPVTPIHLDAKSYVHENKQRPQPVTPPIDLGQLPPGCVASRPNCCDANCQPKTPGCGVCIQTSNVENYTKADSCKSAKDCFNKNCPSGSWRCEQGNTIYNCCVQGCGGGPSCRSDCGYLVQSVDTGSAWANVGC